MHSRSHTTEAAASTMGVPVARVKGWAGDLEQPGRTEQPLVVEYLGVDEDELRRLMLRSQMRRAQALIRN